MDRGTIRIILDRLHAFPDYPVLYPAITGKLQQMQEKYHMPNGLDTFGEWILAGNNLVATNWKAYAFCMSKKPEPSSRTREAQMKLIALLLYIAEQKQKSFETMEQLFSRLMLPGRDSQKPFPNARSSRRSNG